MKNKVVKTVLIIVLLCVFSCDEPETIVTNTVHADGSVTRKIEMKSLKNKFDKSLLQVPFDSTWIIKDTILVGEKRDTTWIKTAEKLFKNVEEINNAYLNDKGANREISRKAAFIRKFKWFYTGYRFSEVIDGKLSDSYKVKDFMNSEELNYFYSPESLKATKLDGQDSLKYRALEDSIKKKTDLWSVKILVSEWIDKFSKLTESEAGNEMTREWLKGREADYSRIIEENESKFDSLWDKGVILKEFIGENNAVRFRVEADTAIERAMREVFFDFKNYSVRIEMPGKVIGTNGFIDDTDGLIWPVKSDYFLTESYEMWAESKVINKWAWLVTGIFILFVLTGLLIRLLGKKKI